MKILMISGKSASGKDAAAFLFKEKLEKENKKVLFIHFADLVKYYAFQYYNWSGEKNEEGRSLLQYIGTGLMRNFDPEYWARIIAEFLAAATYEFDYALIPDWRFKNENEVVSYYNKDVITIRVNRYTAEGKLYINPSLTPEQISHISENELDDFCFDYIIENKGNLDTLEESVTTIISDWRH